MTLSTQFPEVLYKVRASIGLDQNEWIIIVKRVKASKGNKVYTLDDKDRVKIDDLMVPKTMTTEVVPSRFVYCLPEDLDAAKEVVTNELRKHVEHWVNQFNAMATMMDTKQPSILTTGLHD